MRVYPVPSPDGAQALSVSYVSNTLASVKLPFAEITVREVQCQYVGVQSDFGFNFNHGSWVPIKRADQMSTCMVALLDHSLDRKSAI